MFVKGENPCPLYGYDEFDIVYPCFSYVIVRCLKCGAILRARNIDQFQRAAQMQQHDWKQQSAVKEKGGVEMKAKKH